LLKNLWSRVHYIIINYCLI